MTLVVRAFSVLPPEMTSGDDMHINMRAQPASSGPTRRLMYVLLGSQQLCNQLIRQAVPTMILFMVR